MADTNRESVTGPLTTENIPDIGANNEELVRFAQGLFDQAKAHKVDTLGLHNKWSRARRWVDGDQWDDHRRAAYLAEPVTNFIHANSETIQSLITSTRPVLDIQSTDFEKGKEIREIFDRDLWYRLKMAQRKKLIAKDFVELGNGFIKTIWDPFANSGNGEVSLNYSDPYSIFPQPFQPTLQDCKYVLHVFPVYITELLDRYGEKALTLQPEDVSSRLDKQDKRGIIEGFKRFGRRFKFLSPVTSTDGSLTDTFEGRSGVSRLIGKEKGMVLFFELWYKDSRMEKIEFPEDDLVDDEHQAFGVGTTPSVNSNDDHKTHIRKHRVFLDSVKVVEDTPSETSMRERIETHIKIHEASPKRTQQMKYPKGRVISFAQDVLLDDKENPFTYSNLDVTFPWAHYKNYTRGDEFWGDGEIEQMMSPQAIHNRIEALAVDHAILTANSPWVISNDAGVEEETITNAPDMIIMVNGDVNKAAMRLPPGQLSSDIPFLMQNSKLGTEVVPGIPESIQGRRPTGITSGKALESLQGAALNRISPKVDQMMFGDQDMYEQSISLMGQFYNEDRLFRYLGKDGQQQEISLSPQDFRDVTTIRLRARDELGASVESRMQIAMMMVQIGLMTPDLLAEYVDLPGFEQLAAAYRERTGMVGQLGLDQNNGNGTQTKNPVGELLGKQNLGTNRPGA